MEKNMNNTVLSYEIHWQKYSNLYSVAPPQSFMTGLILSNMDFSILKAIFCIKAILIELKKCSVFYLLFVYLNNKC